MAKWEQGSAEEIADMLHRLHAVANKTKSTPRGVKVAINRLHNVLWAKAKEHSEALGIDVAPLSGGTPKELP